ncbi:uncharacterized protein LOC111337801 [Stylophora pistillata]|uniref:uncharacterized protein LOC111337801 n=1 Tax=Stylophora pistillata TaxID=50429 RepID=UPI000C03AC5A|nr:uncharacterized protein LOC111337801 [Stylophora pistillata]
MKDLRRVQFPCSLTLADSEEPPMLCVFSDASQHAFGACVYSRQKISEEKYQVRLITAKSRVAPLKQLSIPRLELQAAVLASRGIPVHDLSGRWSHGPEFLQKPEELWPQEADKPVGEEDLERRQVKIVCEVKNIDEAINPKTFSSWRNLVRVTARIQRLANKIRARGQNQEGREGPLSPEESQGAEIFWIKKSQKSLHSRVKKGEFRALSPFVDGHRVIRVGGRLDKAVVFYETRHPALLPSDHWISVLTTRHAHQHGHSGVAATTANIRVKYWILKAMELSKSVKFKYGFCKEMAHKTETQLMADLPALRLAPYTPPFYHTACDDFGPYSVKIGRNKTTKHYGAIFTCLNTRAVHLEMAVDCSTMEFLQVLSRFLAIRGQPAVLISDNGAQFVGAERELSEMVRGFSREEIQEFCAEKSVHWKFTTPAAPHENGCAESLVKTCKNALKRAIGSQVLAPFELYTVFLEVANLVNQRPIGRIRNATDVS